MMTERLTERFGFATSIYPQTLNNTNATSGTGIDMTQFKRVLVHVQQGANAAAAVLSIQLVEDTASNLGSATNLAGSAAQLTTAGADANKQYTFEVRSDQMTKRYLGVKITETASHAALVSAIVVGDECDHKPGNAFNSADVKTQNVL